MEVTVDEGEATVAQDIEADYIELIDGRACGLLNIGREVVFLGILAKQQLIAGNIFIRRQNCLARDAGSWFFGSRLRLELLMGLSCIIGLMEGNVNRG